MSDMPQVRPRDMHALMSGVVETHTQVRQHIEDAAAARQKFYEEQDKKLNAQARLEGKTAT